MSKVKPEAWKETLTVIKQWMDAGPTKRVEAVNKLYSVCADDNVPKEFLWAAIWHLARIYFAEYLSGNNETIDNSDFDYIEPE